jgi:hypothetical protein
LRGTFRASSIAILEKKDGDEKSLLDVVHVSFTFLWEKFEDPGQVLATTRKRAKYRYDLIAA